MRASALHSRKERFVFVVAASLLAAYGALWFVTRGPGGDIGGRNVGEQRFVVSAGDETPLPDAESVFARAGADTYYNAAIPPRWVMPRVQSVKREPVKLDPPMPTFPSPPMLLPVPGPAIEHATDLPRWPTFPQAGSAGK